MKQLKIFAVILISACYAVDSFSQGSFAVHAGPSFPLSDFASDDLDDENAGGAAVGATVGIQYIYPLSASGLGIFGGIDISYNGLKKDVKDEIEELYDFLGLGNAEIKYNKHISIPISAGLNYTYQADEKIGVFANAGLAVNFLKITNMELKASGETITVVTDLATGIGFKVGGGVLINQKYSVSVDYLGLGKHDIEGEVRYPGYSNDYDGEQKVDLITLTLGVIF